ncbi:MAG: DEAD/DEAH box helicase family protein [Oscillospiraceae bacterium]|nr:DEAD/DEAH box helicase family protein [Oscillospiraceae bacterium]
MNITLANFQLDAIRQLMEAMASDKREVVLKSCTGSGKTIILTHFMSQYARSFSDVVFVWLTPGKGELENQSKKKMDKYIHNASTNELLDVMTSGFAAGDFCFINWEKLTKKGNNALKEGERANFIDWTERALDNGLRFIVAVDESHQNDTIKADEIIELFQTDKIIRCSATPKPYPKAFNIDIPEEDVIAEGLIKKVLVINEDFGQNISVGDQVSYLLEKAIEKQRILRSEFLQRDIRVNPLIIVQLPNNSDLLLDNVERYFEKQGMTYENGQLAVWMAERERKQNLEDIEAPNAAPIAVIIKQAIATGWDCPRAHILVKLRDNMSETFEIQTIGRIRRMPEAKHYGSDSLDSCYLYTLDEKFTEGVKQSLGKGALDGLRLTLKSEHRLFSIITEYKTDVPFPRDAKLALRVAKKYFEKTYKTDGKTLQNQTRLETHGYVFSSEVIDYAKSGSVNTLTREQFNELNTINIRAKLDTHKHGREFFRCVAEIGSKITLDYDSIRTILLRLFSKEKGDSSRILSLEWKDLYAFVINNKDKLKDDVLAAMSDETLQIELPVQGTTQKPIGFPHTTMFFYDLSAKDQTVMNKNVYHSYLSSAEYRSAPERIFEQYCETSNKIKWFYKNGDKGQEYFSIVYNDNLGKQKSFYPDYILGDTDDRVWVIETKGGFSQSRQSEDRDIFTPLKFVGLQRYLKNYNMLGGVVRQDKQSQRLCICTDRYSDNIQSDNWRLLSEVL